MVLNTCQIDSFCPNTKSKKSFSVKKNKFLIIAADINRDFTVFNIIFARHYGAYIWVHN